MEVSRQCLQVERTNTKSNAIYKKESCNSTSLQGKTMMSDDFELGEEDEMSMCVYKADTFFYDRSFH